MTRSDLATHCQDLDLPYDEQWLEAIDCHLELLEKWSASMNLTSVSNRPEALVRHVVDSLSLLRLEAVRKVVGSAVDVGSGAGFPGLPLAVALPQVQWTLLEPRRRRGVFLNQVIARAGIQNATWLQTRLPATEYDGQFKLAVSRATFQPKEVLERLAPLVSENGYVVMMAATQPAVEWPNAWRLVESHSFDVGGAPRWIASFKRRED